MSNAEFLATLVIFVCCVPIGWLTANVVSRWAEKKIGPNTLPVDPVWYGTFLFVWFAACFLVILFSRLLFPFHTHNPN
jgi:hypothetical protein